MTEKLEPQNFKEFKEWAGQEDPESAGRAEVARRETVKNLRKERDPKPGISTVDPNMLIADKTDLGNRIIKLAGGGRIMSDGSTFTRFRTLEGATLWVSAAFDGTVRSIGMTERRDGTTVITEIGTVSEVDNTGGLNELVTIESTDADDRYDISQVQLGISKLNFGQVQGTHRLPSTEPGETIHPHLTREQSDAVLGAAMADMTKIVQEAEHQLTIEYPLLVSDL